MNLVFILYEFQSKFIKCIFIIDYTNSISEKKEFELKERYNIDFDTKLPDDEVPSLRPALAALEKSASHVVTAIFRLLSLDLSAYSKIKYAARTDLS